MSLLIAGFVCCEEGIERKFRWNTCSQIILYPAWHVYIHVVQNELYVHVYMTLVLFVCLVICLDTPEGYQFSKRWKWML